MEKQFLIQVLGDQETCSRLSDQDLCDNLQAFVRACFNLWTSDPSNSRSRTLGQLPALKVTVKNVSGLDAVFSARDKA